MALLVEELMVEAEGWMRRFKHQRRLANESKWGGGGKGLACRRVCWPLEAKSVMPTWRRMIGGDRRSREARKSFS